MSESKKEDDFSFVLGGPLFQFFRKVRLSDDVLQLLNRRIIAVTMLVWLPLFILTAASGNLIGGAKVPFLFDLDVNIKFLIAVPLLIASELVVHRRLGNVAVQFRARNLIPDSGKERFESAVSSLYRLRNSKIMEILLIALVYGVGAMIIWRTYTSLNTEMWYSSATADGGKPSLAGIWFGYISLPVFQFLLLRWYYRLFIWMRFLWQVSRIKLNLAPLHPDRVGGLGFLTVTIFGFILLIMAHGALVTGQIGNQIFYYGGRLPDFIGEILLFLFCLLLLMLIPLLVFSPQLILARRQSLAQLGSFSLSYVREFQAKWLRGNIPPGEKLIGSPDIQSMADLGNSFEIAKAMRRIPVTKDDVIQLTLAAIAPILPLILTMMPVEELMKKLFGIFI